MRYETRRNGYFVLLYSTDRDAPRHDERAVTIPKEIRETHGIEPGDEVALEETDAGYAIRKQAPTTAEGGDPFEKYRGSAASDETMPEWMRRLRGTYPRDGGTDDGPVSGTDA